MLTKNEIEPIHYSSVEILEKVGIQVQSELILKIFSIRGAEIDSQNRRVRIPILG